MRALRRAAAANASLLEVARPRMIWLRNRIREAVWLAEWRGKTAVLVGTVDAPERIPYVADIGSVCQLHCTATGKAIAAYLPRDVLREALGRSRLRQLTGNTITSRNALRAELEQVRTRGYAMNDGETEQRRIAAAVPIFDSAGKVCASIASVLSSEGWNTRKKDLVIASTKSAAEGVSQALAGIGFVAE